MWYFLIAIIPAVLIGYCKCKKQKLNLVGKHVFITGGSKGIGRSLAQIVAQAGAHVTIIARDVNALEQMKNDLMEKSVDENQKIIVKSVDVSGDYIEIEKAVSEAESISGPINLLICCAGTSVSQRFEELPIETFKNLMNINYFGTVNTIKAALPSMKNNTNGHIIMFSSIAGLFGIYGFSAYSASKFAVVGLAQALNMEVCDYQK